MHFNDHSQLVGKHAFLSASKHHWINYDEEKLDQTFSRFMASVRGTELHELAHRLIYLGVKLPKTSRTLNLYVNDAIGYKMHTEQVLYYSDNCFGTADTISFRNLILRIHDLKNGTTPASMNQLLIYSALFCLEYSVNPFDIEIELRLYQLDDVLVRIPTGDEVLHIMDKIITFDKRVDQLKFGG
jgi:hypothetical protein